MRKIVIDMQNYLFADVVAAAFKSSDYDIEVIRAEPPRDTVELCQIYEPFVLVMEVTGYAPWKLGERLRLRDEVKALCAQYTFVRNIPQERVVGDSGSLFCVVPRDPNATVAVNRARWDEAKGGYETLDVLYRSESGDPILLYACADMGESPFPDTEITVTDSSGRTAVWRPRYGTSIRPDDYDTDAPMGYDFTNYSQEHGEDYDDDYGGDVDGDVSWMAPTAEQLCRNMWVWDGDLDRQYAIASIFFEPGGWVTFEWWYEEDNGAYQEVYEGDWSLQDDMLGLRMTRTGGERFREGERAVEITGVFPVQIPMGFEDFPILNIAEGVNGELLPIQIPPSTLIYFLPAMG